MKRALLFALTISVCSWSSAANAQDFDPKEAIVGAWIVDLESVLSVIKGTDDEEEKMALGMMLGMASANVYEIRENGDLLAGGAEHPIPLLFEVDDAGLLWGMPKDGGEGKSFQCIRFDSMDRVVLLAKENQAGSVDLPFVRFLPEGLLESDEEYPEADSSLQGFWAVDEERLKSMPWLQVFEDPAQRENALRKFIGDNDDLFSSFGFVDGGIYLKPENTDDKNKGMQYKVVGADERVIALHIFQESAVVPFLARVEFMDDDHMQFWWTNLSAGPIPMIRTKEVVPAGD